MEISAHTYGCVDLFSPISGSSILATFISLIPFFYVIYSPLEWFYICNRYRYWSHVCSSWSCLIPDCSVNVFSFPAGRRLGVLLVFMSGPGRSRYGRERKR